MLENFSLYQVAVEGNIGSGKSTCLEYFKNHKQVEVIILYLDMCKE